MFGGKYVQFRVICSLQDRIIINTFWVDPHLDLLQNALVKPKNCCKNVAQFSNEHLELILIDPFQACLTDDSICSL